jgi:hypothetical protein
MLEQRWHRKPAHQRLERPDFPAQTLFPVRSEVPLHDGWFAGGRTVPGESFVGVPVRQP